MKIIGTKTHGILDYLTGVLLLLLPLLAAWDLQRVESRILMILGVLTIIYSLITNYEWGVAKIIPMKTHLIIDFLSGAFLAISPWIFDFKDVVYIPHVVLGIFEMAASIFTSPNVKQRVI